MHDDPNKVAVFMEVAIRELGGFNHPSRTRVLDFGCGTGQLLHGLLQRGFDAFGCDIAAYWSTGQPMAPERFSTISLTPYRLPFGEGTFDVVVSTSVLEHAQNKAECFQEIHRVLRPGGYSMHLYPGKWYLPYEPHIFVPLVNYLWPKCPKWWLGLWALLGVRNEFQRHLSWKAVLESNHRYCREELSYWPTRRYRRLSLKVFGNCSWPMTFYIDNSYGTVASTLRRLPFKRMTGLLARELRMGFMIQQKAEW